MFLAGHPPPISRVVSLEREGVAFLCHAEFHNFVSESQPPFLKLTRLEPKTNNKTLA